MKAGFDSAQAAQNDRSLSLVKLGALSGGTIEPLGEGYQWTGNFACRGMCRRGTPGQPAELFGKCLRVEIGYLGTLEASQINDACIDPKSEVSQ